MSKKEKNEKKENKKIEEKPKEKLNKEEIKEIKKEIKEEFEKVEREIEEESEKISSSLWFVGLVALIVGLIVGLLIGGFLVEKNTNNSVKPYKEGVNVNLNEKQIKNLVSNTLKKLIFEQAGIELSPEVVDYKDNGEFYNVTVKIKLPTGQEQETPVYLSKDGKYLFLGVVKTINKVGNLCEVTNKTEKPKVIVAVMANCPFGNQVEPLVKEVVDLFGDKIEVEPRYIFYRGKSPYGESTKANNQSYWSLHGNYELEEGLFELTIWKLYGTKTWIDFTVKVDNQCYKGSKTVESVRKCAEKIAQEMNLNVSKIENYLKENRNKMIEEQAELTTDQHILGSPTIIINGETYKCPRTAEALKQAICSAFVNPPSECGKELSNESKTSTGVCK
jgi:F0F1-type ATP synthase assembly protein I